MPVPTIPNGINSVENLINTVTLIIIDIIDKNIDEIQINTAKRNVLAHSCEVVISYPLIHNHLLETNLELLPKIMKLNFV